MLEIHSQSDGNSVEYHWTCSVKRSQKARTVFNPPFSLLHLTLGDNRRPALPLCPPHNPSSSAVSQEDIQKSITFISRDENSLQGAPKSVFSACVSKSVPRHEKWEGKQKKEGGKAWLCYFSSLMRENERKAVVFCLPLLATT